jgi:cell division protein FtsZ
MTLNLMMPSSQPDLKPRITVFGVGGAGGNAVNNMIDQNLDGCEFVVANTDAQALAQSRAHARIQMGARVTEGLGAGARPAVGASAAEESIEEIVDHLAGVHMAFITAGMGGGTGTGAAPIIAQAARELGVLTVGVVTKPFQFEGAKRMRQADEGIEALQKVVDTLIIIPNQNLFRLANEKTTFTEAFAMADDVLYQGVKGVTDLMVRPGLINLDFADVRAVMNEMGKAMMGTGEADGESRALQAAEKAIANPLLDEISLKGARGVLINITGGYDLTLFELDEAANRIREEVDPEANIIVGSTLDTAMEGRMRVSVVATGIDVSEASRPAETPRIHAAAALAPRAEPAKVAPEPAAPAHPADDVHAFMPERQPEPSLFAGLGLTDAHSDLTEDDIDAPVYRPAAAPAASAPVAPMAATRRLSGDADTRRPSSQGASGARPTTEMLANLRDALQRDIPAARPAAAEPAFKSRLGSLIGRMTGHTDDAPAAADRRQPPVQSGLSQRPAMSHAPRSLPEDSMVDPEQERIEIPAFLRRQAN